MKNCELPELGSCARAMPTAPVKKLALLVNSAGRSGSCELPVPVLVGSPGLRHEAGNDAKELAAIVKTLRGERAQPVAGLRREIRAQLDRHIAVFQRHF